MSSLWSHSDSSPISAESFRDLIMPTWARLYIEVSSAENNNDLAWNSGAVSDAFIFLTGIDPVRAQYGALEQQQRCLTASKELRDALFEADEVAQLDGQDALDYATGWMAFRDLISTLIGPISPAIYDALLERAKDAHVHVNTDHFCNGFFDRFKIAEKQFQENGNGV